jgi:hypothetical protein
LEEEKKTMTTLHQGKAAIADNLARYVSAEDDPATHNLNVALDSMLDGLLGMERDIEKIKRTIDQIASRTR